MKIIFKNKKPHLGDVMMDQFFVDTLGRLCQKVTDISYVVIADSKGLPFCNYLEVPRDMGISRVLPPVEKIEF